MTVAANTRSQRRAPDGQAAAPGGAISAHGTDNSAATKATKTRARGRASANTPAPAWAVLVTVAAWCLCSGGRMFANKALYKVFPFPWFITGAAQLVAYAAGVALTATGVFAYRPCRSYSAWLRIALPACLATCTTLYSGNAAVMLLPVSFVQIAKGFTPSVTLVLAAAMGTETLSAQLVLSVLLISVGSGLSCLQGGGLSGVSTLGFTLQVRQRPVCSCTALLHAAARTVPLPLRSVRRRAHHKLRRVQLVACVSEALRAIHTRSMQVSRPEGYNLAESLRLLCLPNGVLLLACSAMFEAPAVWAALPSVAREQPALLAAIAGSSVLTDLTCFLALKVRIGALVLFASASAVS